MFANGLYMKSSAENKPLLFERNTRRLSQNARTFVLATNRSIFIYVISLSLIFSNISMSSLVSCIVFS